jgi:hypothetical protein
VVTIDAIGSIDATPLPIDAIETIDATPLSIDAIVPIDTIASIDTIDPQP